MREGKLGVWTGVALTVSNMVGTGVFTSLGYQVFDDSSLFSIVLLWTVGGVTAFCGALSYYALLQLFPDSGGEVHFIRQLYGKWASLFVALLTIIFGFAAPMALSGMAFGAYVGRYISLDPRIIASLCLLLITLVHVFGLKISRVFQGSFFVLKISLILVLCSQA